MMSYLSGLSEYINEHYSHSILDDAFDSGELYHLYVYVGDTIQGRVTLNEQYDIEVEKENGEIISLTKTDVKFLCHSEVAEKITKIIKINKKIAKKKYVPIVKSRDRYHIKNKTLFPLMEERVVVICTMLEGEQLKGLISNFSRYEITLNLKGGIPLTIFRHAVLDLTDKKKRCYLKSFQQSSKDWKNSQLYVSQDA